MHETYQFGKEHGIKLMIGIELDQLQRRGYFLENRCFFCLSEVEMVDHLLLQCAKTRVLWNLLFSLFGVSWILSYSVKETLLGWHGLFVGKTHKKAWQTTPLCIFWTVWKKRNLIVFDNEELSIQRLKNSFVYNPWSWSRMSVDMCSISLVSFIDWLGSKWGQVMFLACFPPTVVKGTPRLGVARRPFTKAPLRRSPSARCDVIAWLASGQVRLSSSPSPSPSPSPSFL